MLIITDKILLHYAFKEESVIKKKSTLQSLNFTFMFS